jgi:hypothetical protein
MTRWFLASLSALILAGTVACGDDGGTNDPIPDGGGGTPDAGPDASTGGTVEDFDECVVDTDCKNTGSDCRMVGWTASKQCLPACTSTDQCGFNTYCYPSNSSTTLGTNFAFMANHCWFSICGPGRANGDTGGACKLGKEAGIPAGEQLDGFCLPIEDGLFGQCLEAGTVAAGGACDLSAPTRSGHNCDTASLCVGQSGAAAGTCAQVCDPRKVLTGGDDCTNAAEDCMDSSSLNTYSDGSTARSTVGFCNDVTACALIGPNTCPTGQGCAFTNPLRGTGICDASAEGNVALGATCGGTGDDKECAAGNLCLSTCRKECDHPTPRPGHLGGSCTTTTDCVQQGNTCDANICVLACGGVSDQPCPEPSTCTGNRCVLPAGTVDCNGAVAGTTCKPVPWDSGNDMQSGTADDVFTSDWGMCAP